MAIPILMGYLRVSFEAYGEHTGLVTKLVDWRTGRRPATLVMYIIATCCLHSRLLCRVEWHAELPCTCQQRGQADTIMPLSDLVHGRHCATSNYKVATVPGRECHAQLSRCKWDACSVARSPIG
jgi:hypothetical protein